MGGLGSGIYPRKRRAKRTTEDLPALDVRALKREGLITPGQEELFIAEAKPAAVRLRIAWTPSGFIGGGLGPLRPAFVCPGAGCGRRALILYLREDNEPPLLPDPRFLCRLCLDLAYPSQRETPILRSLRRLEKARARLVAPDAELPDAKPKGMHYRTFVRLGREYLKARREHAVLYAAKYAPGTFTLRERTEDGPRAPSDPLLP